MQHSLLRELPKHCKAGSFLQRMQALQDGNLEFEQGLEASTSNQRIRVQKLLLRADEKSRLQVVETFGEGLGSAC